jgi:hypothetical protein
MLMKVADHLFIYMDDGRLVTWIVLDLRGIF